MYIKSFFREYKLLRIYEILSKWIKTLSFGAYLGYTMDVIEEIKKGDSL